MKFHSLPYFIFFLNKVEKSFLWGANFLHSCVASYSCKLCWLIVFENGLNSANFSLVR
jgi:hypothetical protein